MDEQLKMKMKKIYLVDEAQGANWKKKIKISRLQQDGVLEASKEEKNGREELQEEV